MNCLFFLRGAEWDMGPLMLLVPEQELQASRWSHVSWGGDSARLLLSPGVLPRASAPAMPLWACGFLLAFHERCVSDSLVGHLCTW